jgi:IclR family pca regulon transcriptional regulator
LPEDERRTLAVRVRADLMQRGGDLDAFDRRLAQAGEEPVAVVRDAWRRGIGGVAIALKQQDQLMSLTIPVATGSISEEDMRGRLATMLVEASHYLATDGAPAIKAGERRAALRQS